MWHKELREGKMVIMSERREKYTEFWVVVDGET